MTRPLDEVAESVADLVQGSVVSLPWLPVLSTTQEPLFEPARVLVSEGAARPIQGTEFVAAAETALGQVMVITQTCDLQEHKTRAGRVLATVAPIVQLTAKDAEDARAAKKPHFVAVPWISNYAFADLDQATAIDRAVLAPTSVVAHPPEAERRRLAYLLGRAFARPALPNAVDRCLAPLRTKAIKSKDVNVRRLLDEAVLAIRVRPEPEYGSGPVDITVWFMIDPYWIPEAEPVPFGRTLGANVQDVAGPLVQLHDAADVSEAGRIRGLWQEFLDRLAAPVRRRLEESDGGEVRSVSFEAVTALTQEEFDRSDLLDLSHLSLMPDDDVEDE